MTDLEQGSAPVNGASLYYEIAGQGQPLVFLHAGVADRRLWDGQFTHFAARGYRVLRYDMRGYGNSAPVPGDYSHLEDCLGLLDVLGIQAAVLVGCSMGGGVAIDLTLTQPERVRALALVGAAPNGLNLDVPESPKFAEAEAAYHAQDWDRLLELETQIWFDGEGRSPAQVNPDARALAVEMNRIALANERSGIAGKAKPGLSPAAAERLAELRLPLLLLYGTHDDIYIRTAARYMGEQLPQAQVLEMANTAHLPSLEQPAEFNRILEGFLAGL